jgi:hypothetical protein
MSQSLSCIYLHELTQDGKGIDWKNAYQALPADKKAPVIIGTGSLNAKSAGSLIYIQRPFGLGMFLDMIEAAFDSLDANQQNFEKDRTGIQASYQVPAKLLGLDENGGILEIKTPVLEGSQLLIEHSFLKQAWHGNTKVTVVATDKVHGYSDTWHLKFKAVGVGMNKAKYWAAMKQAFYNLAKEQQSLSTRSNNELEKKLA